MRRLYFILMFVFFTGLCTLNAQSYYHYKDKTIDLTTDRSTLNIVVLPGFNENELHEYGFTDFVFREDHSSGDLLWIAKLKFMEMPDVGTYLEIVDKIGKSSKVVTVAPYFRRQEAPSIGTSHIFYVKLKQASDYGLLEEYANNRKVKIVQEVPFMKNWYRMTTTPYTRVSSLEVANFFSETGLFAAVDPGFVFRFRLHAENVDCAEDAQFNQQWGLLNNANFNLDIDVCDAWDAFNFYGAGVNVAVVDQGIDLTHRDLVGNILSPGFDAQNPGNPSNFNSFNDHGTYVAGIIAATKDDYDVVGVAPQANLIGVSHDFWMGDADVNTVISEQLAVGISWAWSNAAADVINCSWGDYSGTMPGFHTLLLENAIDNALALGRGGRGTVVVFSAGNQGLAVDYPANYRSDILCVGAMGQSGNRYASNYGSEIDVVAPGQDILSTLTDFFDPSVYTGIKSGSTAAAPFASGLAALIISANSNLTGLEIRDIIERTAQKVGTYAYYNQPGRTNGTWHTEVGYGLINAKLAVEMAIGGASGELDLYIRDTNDDTGEEPNPSTYGMCASPDIWVRNTQGSAGGHQNPVYDPANPNYVYVKVMNRGSMASTGTETVELYWAKAGTGLGWPSPWQDYPPANPPMGGLIGIATITNVIQPGQSEIVEIEWNNIPNPDNYAYDRWHFCLLAQIVTDNDPMVYTTPGNLDAYVRRNNNVAWKNVTITGGSTGGGIIGGVIGVRNPYDHEATFDMEFRAEKNEPGNTIFEEAEVYITVDELFLKAWERGGNKAIAIEKTNEEGKLRLLGKEATIQGLVIYPDELLMLDLTFNFLTRQVSEKPVFTYHIFQNDAKEQAFIGGEKFEVYKNPRELFLANAGDDKAVHSGASVTLTAEDIGEPAAYNWYDGNGTLVYRGRNYTTTAAAAQTYKLEVIADADGYKDYDNVRVNMKSGAIVSISPNPSSNNILVKYNLDNISSANIMIRDYYGGGMTRNYPVNTASSEININVSTFTAGMYNVILLCDGKIVDTKTFIKN